MTLPTSGTATSGLRFRLFGFPVRIDISFVIVMALLGLPGGFDLARIALWVALGAVAVLLHELGHAFLARTTGARPTIELYAFGGATHFVPPGPLTRLRSIAISLSGPLVGVAIGLALLAFVPADTFEPDGLGDYAREIAVFVNLGWGVLNLLPLLPLDGGHVLQELLPGSEQVRRRRALVVSLVVAAVVAAVALSFGYIFGAVLAGFLAFGSWQELRPAPQRRTPLAEPSRGGETDAGALWLVDNGRYAEARHLVDTAPPDRPASLAVAGLVLAVTGGARTGREMTTRALTEAPADPVRFGAYVRLLALTDDWAELERFLRDVPTEQLDTDPQLAAVRALPGWAELRSRRG